MWQVKIVFFGILLSLRFACNGQMIVESYVKHIDPSATSTVGSISLTPSGGSSPYTYSWSPGSASVSSIGSLTFGIYTATVTDNSSVTVTRPYSVGYRTFWTNPYGIIFRNDSLIYDSSVLNYETIFNCAISKNTLKASTDGWAEVVFSSASDYYLFGFLDSSSVAPGLYTDIDYGFHISPYTGLLYSWVMGSPTSIGSYSVGDVMRIDRTGTVFSIKQNGVTVYTLTVPTNKDWKLKASISGPAIRNVGASFIDTSGVYFPNYVQNTLLMRHASAEGAPDGTLSLSPNAGYSFTWTPGPINTSSISEEMGTYSVTVSDPNTNSSKNNFDLLLKTQYQNLEGMVFRNDSLLTTYPYPASGWCTATNKNELQVGEDGELTWVAPNSVYYLVTGFLDTLSGTQGDYWDIDQGLFEQPWAIYYWSAGYYTLLGNRLPGDVMKIKRIGANVKFYRNNDLLYTATPSNTTVPWKIKTALTYGYNMSNIGTTVPPTYKTYWTNPYGITFRNDSLIYNYSVLNYVTIFNGIISKNTLRENTDGYAEVTVHSMNDYHLFGFIDSSSVSPGVYTDIDFGLHLDKVGQVLYAWTGGGPTSIGSYTTGDVLRVGREGSTFKILQNGVTVYTLTAPTNKPWKLKTCLSGVPIYDITATFNDTTNIYFPNYVQNNTILRHATGLGISSGTIILSPAVTPSLAYSYSWSPGGGLDSVLMSKPMGTYTVKVWDENNNSSTKQYDLLTRVKYENFEGMMFRNDSLITIPTYPASGWCTATSINTLAAGADGSLSWIVPSSLPSIITGFLDTPSGSPGDYVDIDEGVLEVSNAIYYISGGSYVFLCNRLPGDAIKVKRIGSNVKFYSNDKLLYTSSPTNTNVVWKVKTTVTAGQSMANIGCSFKTSLRASVEKKHVDPSVDAVNGAVTVTPAGGTPYYDVTWAYDAIISPTRELMTQGSYTYIVSDSTQTDGLQKVVHIGSMLHWGSVTNATITADTAIAGGGGTLGIVVSDNLLERNAETWFEGKITSLNHDIAMGFISITNTTTPATPPSFTDAAVAAKIALADTLMQKTVSLTLPFGTTADSVLNLADRFEEVHLMRLRAGAIRSLEKGSEFADYYTYQVGDVVKIGRNADKKIYMAINDEVIYTNPVAYPDQYMYPIITINLPIGIKSKGGLLPYEFYEYNVFVGTNYAVLRKKMNAGYHQVPANNILNFKYDAEYNSGNISYQIFSTNSVVPVNSTPSLSKNYGDNRYSLNLGVVGTNPLNLNPGYYYLEVTNEKNEVFKLKFKKN